MPKVAHSARFARSVRNKELRSCSNVFARKSLGSVLIQQTVCGWEIFSKKDHFKHFFKVESLIYFFTI